MWEYLLYILCVALFAWVWYNLGSKKIKPDLSQEIEDQEQYVKRLEEEIDRLKCELTSLHIHNAILDEELNGYQSGKDKSHD